MQGELQLFQLVCSTTFLGLVVEVEASGYHMPRHFFGESNRMLNVNHFYSDKSPFVVHEFHGDPKTATRLNLAITIPWVY